MSNTKSAKSALISVFSKDGLAPIVKKLDERRKSKDIAPKGIRRNS